jgi:formyltetrahydrofolate deformylase
MKTNHTHLRLVASCPDHVGILARVAGFIADQGANITAANQYEDVRSKTFFMRYGIELLDTGKSVSAFESAFSSVANELRMDWRLTDLSKKQRVVLLVSKFDHCLAYLLHRWKVGDLNIDIPCVISNHEKLRELVEWYGIPFHYVPVPKEADAKQAGFE